MISEEIVEETWREVATFPPERARREMKRITRRQPDLLAFVFTATEDLSPDAHELAVYLFFVVHRMFEKSKHEIHKVEDRAIIERYESNEQGLLKLEGADERFFERAAMVQASRQPWVLRYVVETLMEAPESDEPVPLDDDEVGAIFFVLQTVIDVLDEAARD